VAYRLEATSFGDDKKYVASTQFPADWRAREGDAPVRSPQAKTIPDRRLTDWNVGGYGLISGTWISCTSIRRPSRQSI
jgi:hypothetical protein